MTLNVLPRKDGRILLAHYDGKWVNGKTKKYKVQTIGFVDELEKEHPDPIAFYREEARRLTAEKRRKEKEEAEALANHYQFEHMYSRIEGYGLEQHDRVINYGAIVLSRFYHELGLDYFIDNRRRYTGAEYNHNSILKMLTYGRILFPGSKLSTWREREQILEDTDFTDDDVYSSLRFFAKYRDDMVSWINRKLAEKGYRADDALRFYDVTNYYWEIEDEDGDELDDKGNVEKQGMRRKGCSKEHRPDPIVQMGLMMDSNGLPVNYGLFPGNCNDVRTFIPMMEKDGSREMIHVADKGMMSSDNIASLILNRCGFVISRSVRNCDREMRGFILDEEGYSVSKDGKSKIKERTYPVTLYVTSQDGKKKRVSIDMRQVVVYSVKYKRRAMKDRDAAVKKAEEHAKKHKKDGALNTHGANKYIKKTIFDEEGAEVERPGFRFELDDERIASEQELDGYYLIYTNVYGSPELKESRFDVKSGALLLNREVTAGDVASIYKELWRIEENFRITKSICRARPVYVRREESIEAHFLSCYVALVILRMMEIKTGRHIEINLMVWALRKAKVLITGEEGNNTEHGNNVLWRIGHSLGMDLTRKRYSMKDLKKMVAESKKQ